MSGRLGYGSEQSLGGSPGTVPSAVGDVPLGVKASAVVCGTATTCIIHGEGLVRCWGLGYRGSLGAGSDDSVGHMPTRLPRDAPDADVGARVLDLVVSAHTCALVEAAEHVALGHVRCWGPNNIGQLGYGHTDAVGDTPTTTPRVRGNVPVGALVRQVDVGLYHTCVVTEAFRLRCWGGNEFGQLGLGRAGDAGGTPSTTPEQLGDIDVGPLRVLRVACGAWHTCVLLEDQSVKCWGRGETASGPAGAIGYGDDKFMSPYGYLTVRPAQLRAVRVGGKVALLRAGRAHTCAVLLDENAAEDDEVASTRIRCWGWNSFGQLGYGHRRSVGADTSFLPPHAGDVPVDPVRHDPWMVIDTERELALQPYGRHGHELPFRSPSYFFALGMMRVGAVLVVLVVLAIVAFRWSRSRNGGGGGGGAAAAVASIVVDDHNSGVVGKRD
jgi:alpha-tubulin suppressor-like RCC1 family protein